MSVLEAPQTWIAAAAVLVVIAVVLIALAPRRRGGTGSASGPAADPASASAATAEVMPVGEAPADRGPDPGDADTGPVLPVAGVRAADGVEEEADAPTADETTAAVPATPRPVAVTDPARAGERAKDRLLAALLTDPAAAVDVVAALPENGAGASGASGTSAAALLRTGLNPAQVAGLCGVREADLATLVARDLGLLGTGTGIERDRVAHAGSSRTDEPGRAWASVGSPVGSTTPTTG